MKKLLILAAFCLFGCMTSFEERTSYALSHRCNWSVQYQICICTFSNGNTGDILIPYPDHVCKTQYEKREK